MPGRLRCCSCPALGTPSPYHAARCAVSLTNLELRKVELDSMASILRVLMNNVRRRRLSSRECSTVAHIIHTETPIEEETLPHYKAEHYYPVRIGNVYHARYKVAGKLGYRAYSTTWLCRDLQCANPSIINPRAALTSHGYRANNYTVLKVSTSLPDYPTAADRELRVYKHLAKIDSSHPGRSLIRELYDSFDLHGPGGTHRCLVLQLMNVTLLKMMRMNPRLFDLPLLRMTIKRLLLALDFLHTEAEVIHTGRDLCFIKVGFDTDVHQT